MNNEKASSLILLVASDYDGTAVYWNYMYKKKLSYYTELLKKGSLIWALYKLGNLALRGIQS